VGEDKGTTVATLPEGSRIPDYIRLGVIAKIFPMSKIHGVLSAAFLGVIATEAFRACGAPLSARDCGDRCPEMRISLPVTGAPDFSRILS
jgi:hypothetical protein